MKLTRVTITGADDAVDHQALIDLSAEFPFVEWGVLWARSREGSPRYPTREWMDKLFFHGVQQAVHFCGNNARSALAGAITWPTGCVYKRAQLNGFSKYRLPLLHIANLYPETEFILQVQSHGALHHAVELDDIHPNLSVLWDQSGGEGKVIREFPAPEDISMGYAGGLDPDNLVERLMWIAQNTNAAWIDMESGVRTDDKFDLAKVRRVLEITAPLFQSPYSVKETAQP